MMFLCKFSDRRCWIEKNLKFKKWHVEWWIFRSFLVSIVLISWHLIWKLTWKWLQHVPHEFHKNILVKLVRILPFKQLTRHKSLATVALTCPLWHFGGFCLFWCWWWVDFETDNTQMVRSCFFNFSKKKNFTILEKWSLKEVYEPLHHASESLWLKKVPSYMVWLHINIGPKLDQSTVQCQLQCLLHFYPHNYMISQPIHRKTEFYRNSFTGTMWIHWLWSWSCVGRNSVGATVYAGIVGLCDSYNTGSNRYVPTYCS